MKNITIINGKSIAYFDDSNQVQHVSLPTEVVLGYAPEIEIDAAANKLIIDGALYNLEMF